MRSLVVPLLGFLLFVTAGGHRDARAALPGLYGADAPSRFLVRLEGPTLWAQLRDAGLVEEDGRPVDSRAIEEIGARARAMREAQSAVARELTDYGLVIDDYQLIFNGFLLDVEADVAASVAALPGVVGVSPAPIHQTTVRDVAATIRSDRLVERFDLDGSGTTVAILDTGIDYTHAMLGGSGDPAEHAANDESRVEPGSFPTRKVVGGYDLAGTAYSPACPGEDARCHRSPRPDADPLDPVGLGHGSHVAGIVAGEAAPPRVPAGIAPGASLVALKIFGDPTGAPSSTDLALSALEWVVAHNVGQPVPGTRPPGRIDVVNLSLGTDWSAQMVEVEEAVAQVVDSGVTVVASAGNAGALSYVTGSPGSARMALSVASSVPLGEYDPAVSVSYRGPSGRPETVELESLEGSVDWLPRIPDVGRIAADLVWLGDACSDLGLPRAQGQIALIERGRCSFFDKLLRAQAAGALGVIVFTDGGQKSIMGCGPPSDCETPIGLPGVMIDRQPGIELRQRLLDGETVRAVLDADRKDFLADTISSFSSRGPARFDAAIKPQVTAPGSFVLSALAGGGSRTAQLSGTSMAGPAAAGVTAQLWQRSRKQGLGLRAADIAALVMNHADPGLHIGRQGSGPTAAIMREGAGRVDALASGRAATLVRSDLGIASLSFGQLHLLDAPAIVQRRLQVTNLSDQVMRYLPRADLAFPEEDAGQGIDFAFSPERLTVEPGQSVDLDVTLRIEPEALRSWNLRGAEPVRNEDELQRLEIDGHIWLQVVDEDQEPLEDAERPRVPFYVLARHHGCIASEPSGPIRFSEIGERVEQRWANPCAEGGSVEPFILLGEDAREGEESPGFPARLDIEALGVRLGEGAPGDAGSATISFAVRTSGPRRIPAEAELRVYLDFDMDGRYDHVIFNVYGREVDARMAEGRWVVTHAPLAPGSLLPDPFQSLASPRVQVYDLDESTSVLSVPAGELGLANLLATGGARFGVGVMTGDPLGDFPLRPGYPGYDLAPDGLRGGASFTFDQSLWSCIVLADGAGRSLLRAGQSARVEGGSIASAGVSLTCPVERLEDRMGLLFHYPDNRGAQQTQVRWIERAALVPTETPTETPTALATETVEPVPSATALPVEPTPEPVASPSPTPDEGASPVPTPTPADRTGIASIAGYQDVARLAGASELPLVAGRPAWLRVEVALAAQDRAEDLTARLEASVGGASLGPALGPTGDSGRLAIDGEDPFWRALSFYLPSAWTEAAAGASMTLDVTLLEAATDAVVDMRGVSLSVASRRPLRIVRVPVVHQPGGVGPVYSGEPDRQRLLGLSELERMFPLADLQIEEHPPLRFEGSLRHAGDRRALLHQIARLRAAEDPAAGLGRPADQPEGVPELVYLGILPSEAGLPAPLAYRGGGSALASMGAASPRDTAEAVAMALGLLPIGCDAVGSPEGAARDPAYPHAGGRIGLSGFDLFALAPKAPDAYDFLSDCDPSWIGDYHYRALFDRLAPAAGSEGRLVPAWLVGGTVDLSRERGWLDPLVPMERSKILREGDPRRVLLPGELRLALVDDAGHVLSSHDLDPARLIGGAESGARRGFLQALPRRDDAAALLLLDAEGRELDRRPIAATAAMGLDAVVFGARAGQPGEARILWEARGAAAEIEPARLNVRYSADGGGRWRTLVDSAADPSLRMDLASLPGSDLGILELRATAAGVEAMHREAIGRRSGHPPTVSIIGDARMERRSGMPVLLAGEASDAEDGAIADERLEWTVPSIGHASSGRYLELAAGLPAGVHEVFLRVRDADGAAALARSMLYVGQPVPGPSPAYLPRVARRR